MRHSDHVFLNAAFARLANQFHEETHHGLAALSAVSLDAREFRCEEVVEILRLSHLYG